MKLSCRLSDGVSTLYTSPEFRLDAEPQEGDAPSGVMWLTVFRPKAAPGVRDYTETLGADMIATLDIGLGQPVVYKARAVGCTAGEYFTGEAVSVDPCLVLACVPHP